jgi:hypothetical protein
MLLAAVVLWRTAIGAAATGAQENPPLPDAAAFLAEARKHLRSDEALQGRYTYVEKGTERRYGTDGRMTRERIRVREVYPSPINGLTYKRVVSVNGVPTEPRELERQDREHQRHVEERAARIERETARERERRVYTETEELREEQELIDELIKLYDFRLVRREAIEAYETILVTFHPRPEYQPQSKYAKIAKRFSGRAWISEQDYEVVRVQAEAIEDVTIGWGLLARIYKGTNAEFERRKVNGEIWLPYRSRYSASGRIALVKRIRIEGLAEYSDYKKQGAAPATR